MQSGPPLNVGFAVESDQRTGDSFDVPRDFFDVSGQPRRVPVRTRGVGVTARCCLMPSYISWSRIGKNSRPDQYVGRRSNPTVPLLRVAHELVDDELGYNEAECSLITAARHVAAPSRAVARCPDYPD